MNNNGLVLLGFFLICLVNMPKKAHHAATPAAAPIVAPAPVALPAPLKTSQASDVDIRAAVIHAAPSKLSDNE